MRDTPTLDESGIASNRELDQHQGQTPRRDQGVLRFVRPELRSFDYYRSVGATRTSTSAVLLDANENPFAPLPSGAMGSFGTHYNRYPEAQPRALRTIMSRLFGCSEDQLLMTRGSDEAIDLVVRCFCAAYQDAVVITPPTFGIYKQAALIQGAPIVSVPLDPQQSSQDHVDHVVAAFDSNAWAKIVFICRPNNPLGCDIDDHGVSDLCERLRERAVVVVDEAYIDFSEAPSVVSMVGKKHENLVLLRTLSKSYGLAGVRLGAAIAHPDVIGILRTIAPIYPISQPSVDAAVVALTPQGIASKKQQVKDIIKERQRLIGLLQTHQDIIRVYPSSANFILIKVANPLEFCQHLAEQGIIVRPRDQLVEGGVRISIGTPTENNLLLGALGVVTADHHSSLSGSVSGSSSALSLPQRTASVQRKTNETQVEVSVNLDDPSGVALCTGIAFFDHMLEQIAKHGRMGLRIRAAGDLEVDAHHTIEDVALVLGEALNEALGTRAGIARFGFFAPMDDALAEVVIDLSKRPYCAFVGDFPQAMVGQFPTSLTEHFFRSLASTLLANIHVKVHGSDSHHMVEATFKALGLALLMATHRDGSGYVPSTKGQL